jgi:DNA sulfur modification protein DndB
MNQTNDDNNNSVSPEDRNKFSAFIQQFFFQYYSERCYLGLIFKQGKRNMLQINIPAYDFPSLLVTKPATANDPDSGKQRPEVPGHADEIKQYIIEHAKRNKPWILGTITANVSPDKIKIIDLGRGFCIVVIPRETRLEITDGQHRKTAIQKLIESEDSHLISENDFPITLVLEDDLHQCQKDFRDMAQTKALDKALLLSFGEFEGRVGLTKILVEKVNIFYKKTDKISNSPRFKEKFIYTNNYIARAVSCIFTNYPDSEMREYDIETLAPPLVDCLNQFFYECKNTRYISVTAAGDLSVEQIKSFKDDCLLGVSVGLEVLGRLLNYTYHKEQNSFDEIKVSQLAQIDWSRQGAEWRDNLIRIDPKPKHPDKPYKLSTSATAVSDAVKTVRNSLGWV